MIRNKKGVSDIVITVSMILISIVAVGVISAFVIPMIQKQLAKTGSCVALKDHFQVSTDVSATCYDSKVNNVTKLSIKRTFEKEEAKGFQISIVLSTGDAEAYEVLNTTAEFSSIPGLPSRGGARTYSFPIPAGSKVEKVSIATILEIEEVCDPTEFRGIRIC